MTKKDYQAIADVIRNAQNVRPNSDTLAKGFDLAIGTIVLGLGDMFYHDNNLYDHERFKKEAGL